MISFKKNDWLYHSHSTYNIVLLVKVVMVLDTVILVQSLEYPNSPPYAIQNLKECTLVSKEQRQRIHYRDAIGPLFLKLSYFLHYIQQYFKLRHTTSPNDFKDYLANWLAFFITLIGRIECAIYLPSHPNNWKGITSHGPLWKNHKYNLD